MPQSLDAWQAQLERHFADLAASRAVSKLPIFALEHSLQIDDLKEISRQLRSRLTAYLPLAPHWLLWVIYATEQGYAYDGHEYWDSFEQQTPYWRERGSRQQLKLWFKKFQKTYGGVIPTGTWADWFSIIAWPIRHGILPKYLQLQFAEALYGLRFKLARLEMLQAKEAGHMLASNAWNASSRFQEFLQQEELAGRILLALLNRQISDQSPIYAPTLSRIVSDLESVHRARDWLKETRRAVEQFKGVGRETGYTTSPRDPQQYDQIANEVMLRVRPNLLLRRTDRDSWSVILETPDFAGIAGINTDLAHFLKSTRCQLSGEGIWHPRGWLLAGSQRRALKSWPAIDQPVLKFERSNGVIDNILNADFRISPVPIWLFRISDDGLARQIVGLTVRPGHRYILVTRDPVPIQSDMLQASKMLCEGVRAAVLTLPGSLTADHIATLKNLNLLVNRTIRAWPAGFVARSWDGEGYSEWLTTESPAFGVAHDHPVSAYKVRLDNEPELVVRAGAPGIATFIQIPRLSPGRHCLRLSAQRGGPLLPSEANKDMEGVITLDVRDPVPWRTGTTPYSGFVVSVEPPDPTLDILGEGALHLAVQGPEGRQVVCGVTLLDRAGSTILVHEIAKLELPLAPDAWAQKLVQFLGNEAHAWKLQEATSALITVRSDELGQFVLRLERETRPIRWVCRSSHHAVTVRLIDDTGIEAGPALSLRSFRAPAIVVQLNDSDAHSGCGVSDPGGLYVASQPASDDALIVSTPTVEGGLQGLLIEPDQKELAVVPVRSLLQSLHLWSAARLAGPLAANRRDRVIGALYQAFFGKLCGDRWANAERAYLANPTAQNATDELQRFFDRKSAGFNVILRRDFSRMEAGTGPGTNWFADVANRYGVCSDSAFCEVALRAASQPLDLMEKKDDELASLLAELSLAPELMRGARLVALCTIAAAGKTKPTPGWLWP